MAENRVRYIDLDVVKPETEVVVRLGGKEHEMVPLTVDGFIENLRLVQSNKTSIEDQMMVFIKIIMRAFPTLDEQTLRALTLDQLAQLRDQVSQMNGQKATEDEIAAEAKENPPTAG